MRIIIETVEHKNQRYDTVGDWQVFSEFDMGDPLNKQETLAIKVSRMKDWRSEALVAIHELVEALLCFHNGITAEQVDAWDMNWTSNGDEPLHGTEPGDDPRAPYYAQHLMAEAIERLMASQLYLPWNEHADNVDNPCA